jgi:hypothetical protein
MLLSYITAELWIRFIYDSIYNKTNIVENDESEFAKYYVIKLFRQNRFRKNIKKYFDYIYQWDDHFRYTTLTTCTFTVAYIFLYYIS